MDPALILSASLTAHYGVYIQPGLGSAYPDLVQQLRGLYTSRVAKLPFVPSDWLAAVLAQMGTDVVVKLQQSKPHGVNFQGLPAWIGQNQAAIDAWQQAAELIDSAVAAYANNQVEAGRAIIARANGNAAFWGGLYAADQAFLNLPGTIVGGIGDGILTALKAFVARTWYLLVIAAVVIFLWYNRSAVVAKVNAKVKGAVL